MWTCIIKDYKGWNPLLIQFILNMKKASCSTSPYTVCKQQKRPFEKIFSRQGTVASLSAHDRSYKVHSTSTELSPWQPSKPLLIETVRCRWNFQKMLISAPWLRGKVQHFIKIFFLDKRLMPLSCSLPGNLTIMTRLQEVSAPDQEIIWTITHIKLKMSIYTHQFLYRLNKNVNYFWKCWEAHFRQTFQQSQASFLEASCTLALFLGSVNCNQIVNIAANSNLLCKDKVC